MAHSVDMTETTRRTERRANPRIAALPCPHCGETRLTAWHLIDSGDLDADTARAAGYCPTLAAKRTNRPAATFHRSAEQARFDARYAEAIAAGWTDEPNYAAALATEAL